VERQIVHYPETELQTSGAHLHAVGGASYGGQYTTTTATHYAPQVVGETVTYSSGPSYVTGGSQYATGGQYVTGGQYATGAQYGSQYGG
jgi:hypothetical protein